MLQLWHPRGSATWWDDVSRLPTHSLSLIALSICFFLPLETCIAQKPQACIRSHETGPNLSNVFSSPAVCFAIKLIHGFEKFLQTGRRRPIQFHAKFRLDNSPFRLQLDFKPRWNKLGRSDLRSLKKCDKSQKAGWLYVNRSCSCTCRIIDGDSAWLSSESRI